MAGRVLVRSRSSWAGELMGVAKTGDLAATARWLWVKSTEFCHKLADLIVLEAKRLEEAQAANGAAETAS